MPAARIISLCDELVARLLAAWTGRADPDGAERAYVAPVNLEKPGAFAGRRAWVFPTGFQDEPADRAEDERNYAVEVWVAERIPADVAAAAHSAAARDWLDERVGWLEYTVYDSLDFSRRSKTGLLRFGGRTVRTESALVTVYDWPKLVANKLWMANVEMALKELVS